MLAGPTGVEVRTLPNPGAGRGWGRGAGRVGEGNEGRGGPARSECWPLPASPGASPSGPPSCPNSCSRWVAGAFQGQPAPPVGALGLGSGSCPPAPRGSGQWRVPWPQAARLGVGSAGRRKQLASILPFFPPSPPTPQSPLVGTAEAAGFPTGRNHRSGVQRLPGACIPCAPSRPVTWGSKTRVAH